LDTLGKTDVGREAFMPGFDATNVVFFFMNCDPRFLTFKAETISVPLGIVLWVDATIIEKIN
jgi:hypothetical protein